VGRYARNIVFRVRRGLPGCLGSRALTCLELRMVYRGVNVLFYFALFLSFPTCVGEGK
jgi:hypothetical protein